MRILRATALQDSTITYSNDLGGEVLPCDADLRASLPFPYGFVENPLAATGRERQDHH